MRVSARHHQESALVPLPRAINHLGKCPDPASSSFGLVFFSAHQLRSWARLSVLLDGGEVLVTGQVLRTHHRPHSLCPATFSDAVPPPGRRTVDKIRPDLAPLCVKGAAFPPVESAP